MTWSFPSFYPVRGLDSILLQFHNTYDWASGSATKYCKYFTLTLQNHHFLSFRSLYIFLSSYARRGLRFALIKLPNTCNVLEINGASAMTSIDDLFKVSPIIIDCFSMSCQFIDGCSEFRLWTNAGLAG